MEIAVPKMREGDHSHKNSGSTGSRDGVEGRGSTIDKNVVRRGYTRAVWEPNIWYMNSKHMGRWPRYEAWSIEVVVLCWLNVLKRYILFISKIIKQKNSRAVPGNHEPIQLIYTSCALFSPYSNKAAAAGHSFFPNLIVIRPPCAWLGRTAPVAAQGGARSGNTRGVAGWDYAGSDARRREGWRGSWARFSIAGAAAATRSNKFLWVTHPFLNPCWGATHP
jgi:hypothetical protein